MQAVPGDHAFAQLSSSDNIIAFTTARYSKQPLVIRCASLPMRGHCRDCRPCTGVKTGLFLLLCIGCPTAQLKVAESYRGHLQTPTMQ